MSQVKVVLSKRQIAFIVEMVEIDDKNEAVKKFGNILIEEGLKADDIGMVVDKLMKRIK